MGRHSKSYIESRQAAEARRAALSDREATEPERQPLSLPGEGPGDAERRLDAEAAEREGAGIAAEYAAELAEERAGGQADTGYQQPNAQVTQWGPAEPTAGREPHYPGEWQAEA